ncbi:exported hypothetical protein [Candidatus Xenohaliotis californiensis]|uniref:ABC transporter substrate-binding protein n=1 Tax=Candidatus Xenohaliotis californiensis TaxID=84677 RepID=A0ABP0ES25_9RICK|nr:exported hypothetical protein [Candidatus Xenohaliotis californiensis]
MKKFIIYFLVCYSIQVNAQNNTANQKKIYITTDIWQQNSTKVAHSICKAINRDHDKNNFICEISPTTKPAMDNWLKLVQCDRYQQNTQDLNSMQAIMPLYIEKLSIITKGNSKKNIRNILINPIKIAIDDDRAVDVIKFISKALDISSQISTKKIMPEEYAAYLCSDKVDAIATITSHANQDILNISKTCTFTISSINQPTLQSIVQKDNAYIATTISGGIYPGSPNDIGTLGIATVLMGSKELSEQVINNTKDSITKNLPLVSKKHYTYLEKKVRDIKCPISQQN